MGKTDEMYFAHIYISVGDVYIYKKLEVCENTSQLKAALASGVNDAILNFIDKKLEKHENGDEKPSLLSI